MKPPPQNSGHDLFHWVTVVFIRTARFLILTFISAHLAALGFSFSQETIGHRLPPTWPEKITAFSHRLPYFLKIKDSIFDQVNHWYTDTQVWWTIVVGLPLIAIGASVFLINFFNLYYAFFSPTYNQTHCPFCKQPLDKATGMIKSKRHISKKEYKKTIAGKVRKKINRR